MKLILIRHGATRGNLEHRYLGSTDEALLESEKLRLTGAAVRHRTRLDPVSLVYISPMKRCRETAEILFPGRQFTEAECLMECCFGDFEYRNYQELAGNADYQRFIDSGGTCGFPGGETQAEFIKRVSDGFLKLPMAAQPVKALLTPAGSCEERDEESECALVVHGGTIMALLSAFSEPHGDYFKWQTGNGCAFECVFDGRKMRKIEKCDLS